MTGAPRRPGGRQHIPRPDGWFDEPLDPPVAFARAPLVAHVAAPMPTDPRGQDREFDGARDSAVLVTLADGPDGAEVLLTTRSWDLRSHRGEVSFPGGRLDPGETFVDAALREANEEVGLDPGTVEVIGGLTPLHTFVSRSYIVPVVAVASTPVPLAPASAEVTRVFWQPLADLVSPGTYHAENWGRRPEVGDDPIVLHFFELDDETIWGATARILVDLLQRLV